MSIAEIAKCQVICALCHRRKSIWEQKLNKYPKSREKILLNKKAPIVEEGYSWCSKCETAKICSFFTKRADTKSGLNCWCKDCANEYSRNFY